MRILANSEEFGRVVSEICGAKGLRKLEKETGLSAAYIGAMKGGLVPSAGKLAQFAAGTKISGELAKRYYQAASNVRSDLDIDSLLDFVCEVAGLDTMARFEVKQCMHKYVNEHAA